jgi:hypothetical protein
MSELLFTSSTIIFGIIGLNVVVGVIFFFLVDYLHESDEDEEKKEKQS